MRWLAALALLASGVGAQDAEALRREAPVLTDATTNRIVEGRLAGPFAVWFRLTLNGPKERSLVVSHLADGCPIFVAHGDRALFYDAEGAKLRLVEHAAFDFELGAREGAFTLRWGVRMQPDATEDDDVLVDVPSLLGPLGNLETEETAEGRRIIGNTPSGSVGSATFRGREFHSMVLVHKGGADQRFELRVAALESRPAFPDWAVVVERLHPETVAPEDFLQTWSNFGTTAAVLQGLAKPLQRLEIERGLERSLDWQALQSDYAATSRRLLELFVRRPRTGAEQAELEVAQGRTEEGLKLLETAAQEGDAAAMYSLGRVLFDGELAPADPERAVHWLERAADLEHAEAQNAIGWMYLKGLGVPADPARALRWFRRAVRHDHPRAQCSLGSMYETGEGVAKDLSEAVRWYRRSAEQELPEGQRSLARMYEHGLGVDRDPQAALDWYGRGAEQGDVESRFELGRMLLAGEGVEHDPEKGVFWLTEAAAQGHARAQAALAHCYVEGRGVEKDLEKASTWARKAAVQGDVFAQGLLGVVLAKQGRNAAALAWLVLAAEGGDTSSEPVRKLLREAMAPGELDESERILAGLRKEIAGELR